MQAPPIMSYHTELKVRLGVIAAKNDEFYALVCSPRHKVELDCTSRLLAIVNRTVGFCALPGLQPRMFCGSLFYFIG